MARLKDNKIKRMERGTLITKIQKGVPIAINKIERGLMMKRIATFLLALLMLVPMANVFGGEKELVEISISMFDRGAIPGDQGTYEDNVVTRYINEHMNPLGVNITWISAPRNDARAKYNAMISAGTNPDIFWEYSRFWMDQLRTQEVIIPLEDIIEKYSVQYKEYAKKHAAMLAPFVTLEDGHVYAFTSLRKLTELPVAGIWYRKDILDAQNIAVPTTFDELVEAARKIKAADPTCTPISGSLHYYNTVMGIYGLGTEEVLVDGVLVPRHRSDRYAAGINALRTLFQEGLVDPEYITDESMTRQNQLWASGKSAFSFSGWNTPTGTQELMETVPGADPYPLPNVASEFGTFFLTPQAPARIYTMFTKGMSEEKIQAGVKYIDWLLTDDNWYTVVHGLEGVQYNMVNGFREGIPGAPVWAGNEYSVVTDATYQPGEIAAADKTNYKVLAERYEANIKNMFSHPISNTLPYDYSSNDYSTLTSNFSPVRRDIETQIITNKDYTVEQGLKELDDAWISLGGEEVWAKKNEWFKANEQMYMDFRQAWIDWMVGMANAIP